MNVAAGFAAGFSAITGAILIRYAQTLAMPAYGFGLLAALPFLTALLQIPASYAVERFGHRRLTAVIGILVHRLLWLAIAAVPWIMPHAWWWIGLLVFLGLTNLAAHAATPACTSWAADLVPARIRGRYFGLRGQFVRLITITLSLGLGKLMDLAQADGLQTLLRVLSLLLAVAAVLGATDSLLCFALPDPWHQPRAGGLQFREILRQPLADRNFCFFLAYTALITFATGYIGPYVWVYLIDVVHSSNSEATFLSIVGTGLVGLVGMRFWAARVDRLGCKRVLIIACILVINGASGWALVTPAHKVVGYALVLLSSLGWPGIELATNNILYSMTATSRDSERLGSAFAALYSAVVAVTGTLSGLFGGWLAESLKDWHLHVGTLLVTFHSVLFALSALIRILALLCLLGMHETRARRGKKTAAV